MWPSLVWERGFLGLAALLRAFSSAAPGFEGAFFTSAGFLHTFLTSPGLGGSFFDSSAALLRVIIADVSLVWIFLFFGEFEAATGPLCLELIVFRIFPGLDLSQRVDGMYREDAKEMEDLADHCTGLTIQRDRRTVSLR